MSPPSQMALLARDQLIACGLDSPEEKAAPGKRKKTALRCGQPQENLCQRLCRSCHSPLPEQAVC